MKITQIMPNCQIITVDDKDTIVSYTSPILETSGGRITKVYNEWDYSRTTSKHLNAALLNLGFGYIADMTKAQKEAYFTTEGLI